MSPSSLSPTALQAQTLQKILHEKTVKNSYYDDERYNSTLTPDYNKAYEFLDACMDNPEDFSKFLQEPLSLPEAPHVTTPTLNYVKYAIYGDFGEQLSQESHMGKNRAISIKLLRITDEHPDLFPHSLWETPFKVSGLYPAEILECLEGINWGVYNMAKTPLLAPVCTSLLRPLRYSWDWEIPTTESRESSQKNPGETFEEIYGLLPNLKKFPSFPETVRNIVHPYALDHLDEELRTGLLTYAEAVSHPDATPKKIFEAIARYPRTHTITFFHTLTGISTQPELTAALKKRTQMQKMVDGLKTQDHCAL